MKEWNEFERGEEKDESRGGSREGTMKRRSFGTRCGCWTDDGSRRRLSWKFIRSFRYRIYFEFRHVMFWESGKLKTKVILRCSMNVVERVVERLEERWLNWKRCFGFQSYLRYRLWSWLGKDIHGVRGGVYQTRAGNYVVVTLHQEYFSFCVAQRNDLKLLR